MTDFLLNVVKTVAWCLLVGVLAVGLGYGLAEWRFERKRRKK